MPKWYPLDWPDGYPRTEDVKPARFKVAFDKSLQSIRHELKLLGATGVCVSTNLQLARDGWPDSRSKLLRNDPGVSVYWIHDRKQYVIACDSWDRVDDNIRAISLTIEADRGKARWGCSDVVARSMAAYLSLPGPRGREWWDILECRRDAAISVIELQYKARIRTAHPDVPGGSHERTLELNKALDAARKEKQNGARQ